MKKWYVIKFYYLRKSFVQQEEILIKFLSSDKEELIKELINCIFEDKAKRNISNCPYINSIEILDKNGTQKKLSKRLIESRINRIFYQNYLINKKISLKRV
jgi:hypothetical protein